MPEALTLIHSHLRAGDSWIAEGIGHLFRRHWERSPHFTSLTMWRDAAADRRFLTLVHLRSPGPDPIEPLEPVAGEDLEVLADSHVVAPEIRMVDIVRTDGDAPGDAPLEGYLSISLRKAEPGYAQDLAEELHLIFQSLKFLEGYRGSLIGPNRAVREEVLGAVLWADQASFEASIPHPDLYEVRLYRRIG